MLRLPPFAYLAPRTLAETVDLLARHGADAMLVAGGTDLYPNMKRRLFSPKTLIGLRHLAELKQLNVKPPDEAAQERTLTLGAGITLQQVATNPLLQELCPALATAAAAVSTPQLRAMGTIGGNLCLDTRCTYYNQSEPWRAALGYCMKRHGDTCWVAPGSAHCLAVQSSDTAPVLVALDATVRLVGSTGERWLPVQALYQNDGIAYLHKQPDEILTDIRIPAPVGVRQSYKKLRRRGSFDFPILSVAVALRLAEDGVCTDAKLVLGAVASAPLRISAAEALLVGQPLTDDIIEEAANHAYKQAKPLDNTDMTLAYRKQMVRVYVARALREAVTESQAAGIQCLRELVI